MKKIDKFAMILLAAAIIIHLLLNQMSKEVIIICNSGVGRTVAANKESILAAIGADKDGNDILFIDGKGYREKHKERANNNPNSGSMRGLAAMLIPLMMMPSMYGDRKSPTERGKVDVDIVSEFALIQKKESNLSRSQREWVEGVFHSKFDEVFQEEPEREPDELTGED